MEVESERVSNGSREQGGIAKALARGRDAKRAQNWGRSTGERVPIRERGDR